MADGPMLLLGATGRQGRAVVDARLARRAQVRALGHPVRHGRVPLRRVDNPDRHDMWEFLNGPGYQVDIPALHGAHPELAWTRFPDWADDTFGAAS